MKPAPRSIVNLYTKKAWPYYGPQQLGVVFAPPGCQLAVVITPEQATSFDKAVEHYGRETLKTVEVAFGCLILVFNHITIGIESDGCEMA